MSGNAFFGLYLLVGVVVGVLNVRAFNRPEVRHWSDYLLVLMPPMWLMWPLMLEADTFRRVPEQWEKDRKRAFEKALLVPMNPRRVEAWSPVERELLGVNDTDRWIEKTESALLAATPPKSARVTCVPCREMSRRRQWAQSR